MLNSANLKAGDISGLQFYKLTQVHADVLEHTHEDVDEGIYYYVVVAEHKSGIESEVTSPVTRVDTENNEVVTLGSIENWGDDWITEKPEADPDPDGPDDDEEEPRRRRPAPDPDPDPLLPPDVGTPGFDGSNANLSWGDSPTPGITNFNVYASTGGEGLMLDDVSDDTAEGLSWTLIAQLSPDTTDYTHAGLTSGVRYYYVVTSQLACGTECAETSEVMWVDTGTGETGKLPPITWSEDRIAPDVDDDSSSSCFIATAAYGSASAFEVAALRNFRDGFLVSSAPGRLFTDAYYRFSPALAEAVEGNRALGYIIRLHLAPVVDMAGRFLSMN